MRIQFQNKGDSIVTVEVDAGEEPIAVELMREFLGVKGGNNKPRKAKPAFKEQVISLTNKQLETYEFLVANDKPEGVSTDTVADGLGLNHTTAYHRLYNLVGLGAAHQIDRGLYRHGDA